MANETAAGGTMASAETSLNGTAGWEHFTLLVETESLFQNKDAVISAVCAGKHRFTQITPEYLLSLLASGDPAFSELSARLSSSCRDLPATLASALQTQATSPSDPPSLSQPPPQQTQPVPQPQTSVSQSQEGPEGSPCAKRVALAKKLPMEVWARILEAKINSDRCAAIRARAPQTPAKTSGAPGVAAPVVPGVGSQDDDSAGGAKGRKKKTLVPVGRGAKLIGSGANSGLLLSTQDASGDMGLAASANLDDSPVTPAMASPSVPVVGRGRASSIIGNAKKKRKPGESADDTPAGCPDAFYVLDGFPYSLDCLDAMAEQGVALGAVVSVSVSGVIRMAALCGDPAQAIRGTRVASKQATRPRKRHDAGDEEAARQATATTPHSQEIVPVFSQLHRELKQSCGPNTLWIDVADADPVDAADAAHRIVTKLYETFAMRTQYLAWLKSCKITDLAAPDGWEQSLAAVKESADSLPETQAEAELLHCLAQQACATAIGAATDHRSAADPGAQTPHDQGSECDASQLVEYLDNTLAWLTGTRSASRSGTGTCAEQSESEEEDVTVVRYGDVLAGKKCRLRGAALHLAEEAQSRLTSLRPPIPGKDRAGMPAVPEKSELEREAHRIELAEFVKDVVQPRLCPAELDRVLTLLAFEDMMAEACPPPASAEKAWQFVDERIYLERMEPEVFAQVFSGALARRAKVYTQYLADSDAMLLCLDSDVPPTMDQEIPAFEPSLLPKTTLKQWLSIVTAVQTTANSTSPSTPSASMTLTSSHRSTSELGQMTSRRMEQALERLKPGSASIYNVEERKVKVSRSGRSLWLADGSVVTVSKVSSAPASAATNAFSTSVGTSIHMRNGATFALHKAAATKRSQPPRVTFTATFEDGTAVWIGEQRGVLRLSYTPPSGGVTVFGTDGSVEQVPAPSRRDASWSASSSCSDASFRDCPWDSCGQRLSRDIEEVSRRLVQAPAGQMAMCRFDAGGNVQLFYPGGEMEHYYPSTGKWQHTAKNGEKTARVGCSTLSQGGLAGIAVVTDPETQQVVMTRDDMAMMAISVSGDTEVWFPEGTSISRTVGGVLSFNAPGHPSIQVEGGVCSVVFEDSCRVRHSASGVEFEKPNAAVIRLSSDGTISLRCASEPGDCPEAVVPGEFAISLEHCEVTTPEYDRRKYVVKSDGSVLYLSPDGSQKAPTPMDWSRAFPPRLFKVQEDGSATEYLSPQAVVPWLSLHKGTSASVLEQSCAPDGTVVSVTVAYRLTERASDWTKYRPRPTPSILALEDPQFVESSHCVASKRDRFAVLVRTLQRYRQLPEESMSNLLDALDRFEDQRQDAEPASMSQQQDQGTQGQGRSNEELQELRVLQERLARAMLDEIRAAEAASKIAVAQRAEASKAGSVSAFGATLSPLLSSSQPQKTLPGQCCAPPSKFKPSAAAAERLNYFESEEASDYHKSCSAPPPHTGVNALAQGAASQTVNAAPPTEAQRTESPPAVGMMMPETDYGDDADDLVHTALESSGRQAGQQRQQASKFGQQRVSKRTINQASIGPKAVAASQGQAFVVYPTCLAFGPLEQGFSHQMTLSLTNMSFDSARFALRQPRDDAGFVKCSYLRGPVAPGMTAKVTVELRATCVGRVADEVCVVCGDDAVIRVPVTADVLSKQDHVKLSDKEKAKWTQNNKAALSTGPASSSSSPAKLPAAATLPPVRR